MALNEANKLKRPELLAPAGDWLCAKAAVANGADAIYFGLDCGFNARARAANFPLDELPALIEFLHRHGVRGYVTLNTLAFSDELAAVESTVRHLASAGVDAVLVQDLGVARLVRRVAPKLSIHASTQMSLSSAECIAVAEQLGIDRVVLPRELSIKEIAKIDRGSSVGLEAFVHGALCVAYSGQCLTSESLGGRSANRGQCAQACRLPYELVCDGKDVDLGDQKYLLSPQDLAAYALVPELIAAGVVSLKIEGRLKSPEYVANITRHYREAIDSAATGIGAKFTPRQVEEMELSFSRGFSVGWLGGCDHKMLVPAVSSAKRGVRIGVVEHANRGRIRIRLEGRLKPGDGVALGGDRAEGEDQGGRVHALYVDGERAQDEAIGGEVEITLHGDGVDLTRIAPGQTVWKTDDPQLTRRLRKTFSGELAAPDVAIDLSVRASVGEPLQLVVRVDDGRSFSLATAEPLAEAIRHPLSSEVLETQFGRLGGSGFALRNLAAAIDGRPMAPLSVLGVLRKELVARLKSAPQENQQRAIAVAPEPIVPRMRSEIARSNEPLAQAELHALARSLAQLQCLVDLEVPLVYVDFQDIREYRRAVELAAPSKSKLFLATPQIQKPDEFGVFRVLHRYGADGILARNLAGLAFFAEQNMPCVADFSLNAANELTVDFLRSLGAMRITASYDLNREQLIDLVRGAPADLLEVTIHQHMPMFHMEHCVFCAVLSPGTNKTNCGRPCDVHEVRLRDRTGVEHPLRADVGCRNTLYNAAAQSGAEATAALLQHGVRHFRIELLGESSPTEIARVVGLYRDLIAGKIAGGEVWRQLKAVNRVGVTRGTLEERRDPLAIL